MNASFLYAVEYVVTAECITPLRTGNADGDVELVLTDSGRFLIQGTSIAGVLRDWIAKNKPELELDLFGSQEKEGRLIISDGVFQNTEMVLRPRVRINGATGTAKDGGKFDVAHIPAESSFCFTVVWRGLEKQTQETEAIEAALAAMDAGEITIGAQRSNGFGQVKLTVQKASFDLANPDDRKAWRNNTPRFNAVSLTNSKKTCYTFQIIGSTDSILVKSASPEQENYQAGMRIKIVNISSKTGSLIPGSSVKGAFRSRAQWIASASDILGDAVKWLFGSNPEDNNKLPGHARFTDIRLDDEKIQLSRIRINRFTGGVMKGGLFTEEPLSSKIDTTIRLDADECPVAYAMMLYILRDLGCGLFNLGSNGSIDMGHVHIDKVIITDPKGNSAILTFKNQKCELEDSQSICTAWQEAWKEALNL